MFDCKDAINSLADSEFRPPRLSEGLGWQESSSDDIDLVKMLLDGILPQGKRQNIARKLIREFGSFAEILSASKSELMKVQGMVAPLVERISIIQLSARSLIRRDVLSRPLISNQRALMDYLYAEISRKKVEHARILFLDKRNFLLADELHSKGCIDRVVIYPREIIRRALELHSSALIVVRNQTSGGEPRPSVEDLVTTQHLLRAAAALSITLHDHIIVGRMGTLSFRQVGII